uniref:Uncharacterized protein n=1 Tax=Strombidium rassoulzadegani TaxID=1082188 RepID=A0A7S3CJU4_9SPIT|mmetsp:Transcript_11379/g.19189  ORF Transcript_11379/g.19189 Transcript_11379/m.19189 type:complete len:106 (+) Transcript_11379:958-1275(+)
MSDLIPASEQKKMEEEALEKKKKEEAARAKKALEEEKLRKERERNNKLKNEIKQGFDLDMGAPVTSKIAPEDFESLLKEEKTSTKKNNAFTKLEKKQNKNYWENN